MERIFQLSLAVIAILVVSYVTSGDANLGDAVCPDHRYTCRRDQTCCTLATGQYGCCPYADATCCPDLRTCCPHGYSCNNTGHSCYRNRSPTILNPVVPIQLPELNNQTLGDIESNDLTPGARLGGKQVCPDGKQLCPESYTCCAQASGGFGCCPLTGGICCEDRVHCCPSGTRCNTLLGSCES